MLEFENPVFRLYAVAAAVMVVKMMTHSWITVYQMMKVKAGYRLAEDARKTPVNPDPSPAQLLPNESVERTRRIHQNEVENVPLFLAIGLLYVCTAPTLVWAASLLGSYVVTRLAHFYVVMTARSHDARAAAWTIGSLIIYVMAGQVIAQVIRSGVTG